MISESTSTPSQSKMTRSVGLMGNPRQGGQGRGIHHRQGGGKSPTAKAAAALLRRSRRAALAPQLLRPMRRALAGFVALDDVLRLVLRGGHLVTLDPGRRGLLLHHLAMGLALAGVPGDLVALPETNRHQPR